MDMFNKTKEDFGLWLLAHGSAILAPTNQYEVLRFLGPRETCVIYRNESGRITSWVNGASVAWCAFLRNEEWRATERSKRDKKTVNIINSLSDRDGWGCLYCPAILSVDTATLEHIVPLTSGGTNHLANLTLACELCNKKAGHLSAREKFEIALRFRCGIVNQ